MRVLRTLGNGLPPSRVGFAFGHLRLLTLPLAIMSGRTKYFYLVPTQDRSYGALRTQPSSCGHNFMRTLCTAHQALLRRSPQLTSDKGRTEGAFGVYLDQGTADARPDRLFTRFRDRCEAVSGRGAAGSDIVL